MYVPVAAPARVWFAHYHIELTALESPRSWVKDGALRGPTVSAASYAAGMYLAEATVRGESSNGSDDPLRDNFH